MRILIVGMADSIHTVRWISLISDIPWKISLFHSKDYGMVHEDLRGVDAYNVHPCRGGASERGGESRRAFSVETIRKIYGRARKELFPEYRRGRMARLVTKLRPDIVHSLEIQHAGYLVAEVKKDLGGSFPPWIVTNWGSDIYLFGRLPEHAARIREVLASCDYYSCECQRDVSLARQFGFTGTVLPVIPNSGGFDMGSVSSLRGPESTADRRQIMLKGYQSWSGRALAGVRALERCADLLAGYEIVIYSASADVALACRLFQEATGVPVRILPKSTPHREILRHHGHARISLGLNISDAISTSLLEAMVMGSFPIQSWTSCADEWIEDGVTGILVPPEDPEVIERAIRRALTDDRLVDDAAERNYRLSREKLDRSAVSTMAKSIYRTVAKENGIPAEKG